MAENPQNIMQMAYMLQNPAGAMQLQNQQALAQQLMGSQEPDPNITAAGGRAVRVSPISDAATQLQRILGAYLQKDATNKYGQAMQTAQAAPTAGSPSSYQNFDPNAQPSPQDILANVLDPAGHKAKMDAEYAYYNKWHEPQMVNGVLTTPDKMLPPVAPVAAPRPVISAPASSSMPNSIPPIPEMPTAAQAAPTMTAPVMRTTSAGINPNDPAAMKAAETEAAKQAENLADARKTFNVAASNFPRAMERFDELRGAAKDASSGFGIDEEGEGIKQKIAQTIEPKTALANQIISQASKQGVLAELGPQLAGLKGNKFLESIASGASGLNASDPSATKVNAVNGLQRQYIANLKSLAAQRRSYGDPEAPSDAQIDAMVVQHAKIPPSHIAYLKAHPETAHYFEQTHAVPSAPFLGGQQ